MKAAIEERIVMTLKRLAGKRTIVAGAVVLAVAAGAGAAIAAASDAFDPKAEREAFQAAVAEELGVTTKQLQDAYKSAALERLDAAVDAGRITQAQADAMRARIEAGAFSGPMGFGMGPGMRHERGGKHLAAAAEYLGLDVSSLAEKLRSGKSLSDVAKANGKSVDGLRRAIVADAEENLRQAVKDGRITQAQADAMLERLESRVDDLVTGTGPPMRGDSFGPGFGHGPGFGFRGHEGRFGQSFGSPPDA